MKHTTNYSFNKIDLSDSPSDITILNPNFDKIDAELKALTDKDTEIVASINTVKNDYLPKTGGNVTGNLTVKSKHVARSVNGATADSNGNITIDVGGKVQSVNGVTPDSKGNVLLDLGGDVQSVDGVEPDEDGNVQLNALTQVEVLEAAQRVTDVEVDPSVAMVEAIQTGLARVESNLDGVVRSVNGSTADASGNVTIDTGIGRSVGRGGATISYSVSAKGEYTVPSSGLMSISVHGNCSQNGVDVYVNGVKLYTQPYTSSETVDEGGDTSQNYTYYYASFEMPVNAGEVIGIVSAGENYNFNTNYYRKGFSGQLKKLAVV